MEDSEKLKRFMNHVVKATKRKYDLHNARDELEKHIEKVKSTASNKNKNAVAKALKELDKKIGTVIEKEKQAALFQKQGAEKVNSELNEIERKLNSLTTADVLLISELNEKINRLEMNRQDHLNQAVSEIHSALNQAEQRGKSRDEMILELEQKIKSKIDDSFAELMQIEYQIESLELRYKSMKGSGKFSREQMAPVQEKISALKEHAFVKKRNIMTKQIENKEPLMFHPKEAEQKIVQKRDIPLRRVQKGIVRHNIQISPSKAPAVSAGRELIEIPKPPQPPKTSFGELIGEEEVPEIKLRKDIKPKKKGFFARLFG